MKRINVIGTSGSGKSTFSRKLSQAMGCKYIEMDELFWQPNWKTSSDSVFFKKLENAIDADSWVLDGNYNRTNSIKWSKADTIVWIDYSFTRTFYQALMRAIKRIAAGQELWPNTGNKETFLKTFFHRDSIILWTLKNYRKNKLRYSAIAYLQHKPNLRVIRLCSPKEVNAFFNYLEKQRKSITQ
ncbi:AAA family ATPase [Thaumasiovibrio subtropicus]|uniref:AAA family ATPase n=1 Tax=Thaumasiovibrio subtropicus TaxID=1891207 RepID=UPI000B354734|nr:shikimate kinase [Thaumasiovibrio subtropicus]